MSSPETVAADEPRLTIRDATKLVGLPRRTLLEYVRRGELEAVFVRRRWLFPPPRR